MRSVFLRKVGEDKNGNARGEHIYPFKFIADRENADCSRALLRIAARIPEALDMMDELIDSVSSIGRRRKFFYKHSLRRRYETGIVPAMKNIVEHGLCV